MNIEINSNLKLSSKYIFNNDPIYRLMGNEKSMEVLLDSLFAFHKIFKITM